MSRSRSQKLEEHQAPQACSLAKSLAPEEIRTGDYVAVLYVICELPSFIWCMDSTTLPLDEPVRMQLVPSRGGAPLKVKSMCLPWVLVKHPSGYQESLDLRLCRLARLDPQYADAARKAFRFKKPRRKKRRRK